MGSQDAGTRIGWSHLHILGSRAYDSIAEPEDYYRRIMVHALPPEPVRPLVIGSLSEGWHRGA